MLTLGYLLAHKRPPQTNGAEHYDVSAGGFDAGRLTRRKNPHNERPTPGWFVWCAWPSVVAGHILRDEAEAVRYYPTAEAALEALHQEAFPNVNPAEVASQTPPCPCECNRDPKQLCGGCGHAGCGRR